MSNEKYRTDISTIRLYTDQELPNLLNRIIRPGPTLSSPVPAEAVPTEEGHILFIGEHGDFACGVWSSGPGVIDIQSYPVNEFCWLVEGDVVLQDSDGSELHLTPGTAFLIPKGFRGSWISRNKCLKFFSCHGDKASVAALCGET